MIISLELLYIKYFHIGGKNMSFMIQDDSALVKCNKIWNKIKTTLNIKFHSTPAYDGKYRKAKVNKFNGADNTNFSGDKVPIVQPVEVLILL